MPEKDKSPSENSFDDLLDNVLDGPTQVVGKALNKLNLKPKKDGGSGYPLIYCIDSNNLKLEKAEKKQGNINSKNNICLGDINRKEEEEEQKEVKKKTKQSQEKRGKNGNNEKRLLPSYFNLEENSESKIKRKRKYKDISNDDSESEPIYDSSESSSQEAVNTRKVGKKGAKTGTKNNKQNNKRLKKKEKPDNSKLIIQGKRERRKPKYRR